MPNFCSGFPLQVSGRLSNSYQPLALDVATSGIRRVILYTTSSGLLLTWTMWTNHVILNNDKFYRPQTSLHNFRCNDCFEFAKVCWTTFRTTRIQLKQSEYGIWHFLTVIHSFERNSCTSRMRWLDCHQFSKGFLPYFFHHSLLLFSHE